jgi:hypothetical protein
MVRVGERVLIADIERGGKVAVDTKSPVVGKKVLVMDTGENGKIAVRALNVYEKDEGLVVTLPCGSKAFLPSEPPDYFRNTALNESGGGMGCNCSQGAPETNGWICAANCGFRRELGICKISLGYAQNIYNPNFCSHATGRNYWYGNEYIKEWTLDYGCPMNGNLCPKYYLGWYNHKHNYCPSSRTGVMATVKKDEYGNIVYDTRAGACPAPNYLVVIGETRRKAYACVRRQACPYYNGGRGTKMCSYGPSSPPPFQPGGKPPANICQNPGGLSFTGWEVPGGENSNEIRCAFSKATEGNSGSVNTSSWFGDEQIRCQFSVF